MAEPVPPDVLRAIAHPLRLALLVALEDHEQASTDLATALNAAESTVIEQLEILRDAGLVTATSEPQRWSTVSGWGEISAAFERLQPR
jgi:DNA-binding transcriptional ArsR family regulator